MPYVMVPVPEEHEQEVMQQILQLSLRESLNAWDPAVLVPFVRELAAVDRSLVDALADATSSGLRLTRAQVATRLGMDLGELTARADDLNRRSNDLGQPYLVLTAPGEGPDDDLASQVLLVTKVAADLILGGVEDPGR